MKVLVVFADPTGQLGQAQEARAIDDAYRKLAAPAFEYRFVFAARIDDLRDELQRNAYDVVHFSGHSSRLGLLFETAQGEGATPNMAALGRLLQSHSPPLECVLLNSCESMQQAELARYGVPFVIATNQPQFDKPAIAFTSGFYSTLARVGDYLEAFEAALTAMDLAYPGQPHPELLPGKHRVLVLHDFRDYTEVSALCDQLLGLKYGIRRERLDLEREDKDWHPLGKGLKYFSAVALCVGVRGELISNNVPATKLLSQARKLRLPIIPITVSGAPTQLNLPNFIHPTQTVQMHPGAGAQVAERIVAILENRTAHGGAPLPEPDAHDTEIEPLMPARSARENEHFRSVYALLEELDVTTSIARPHYMRMVSSIGMPHLARAVDLPGMVHELSSLGDANRPDRLPSKLLEFLLRLTRESTLKQPIVDWLDTRAPSQAMTRREIENKLRREESQRILLVVVENDVRSNIVGYSPHLCSYDGTFIDDDSLTRCSVQGWEGLVRALQGTLERFIVDGGLPNLQIHFAVDIGLFDRPFHQIPLTPDGPPIGKETIVIVRYRRRLQSFDESWRDRWRAYHNELLAKAPREWEWIGADEIGLISERKGLYFCMIAPAAEGFKKREAVLRDLFALGVPCVYLPHAPPSLEQGQNLERMLKDLLESLDHLARMGAQFHKGRMRGDQLAQSAALLWDDPDVNPFMAALGVRPI